MAIISNSYRNAILAVVVACGSTSAFAPPSSINRGGLLLNPVSQQAAFLHQSTFAVNGNNNNNRLPRFRSSPLHMSAEDFNESKYTEAAWGSIASLTSVADFYQTTTVDPPLLLDVMLNPSRHNAGENAESAKRVVEKVFKTTGVNIGELQSELDNFLSQQPKVSDTTNKMMGQKLVKVLQAARDAKGMLGVS